MRGWVEKDAPRSTRRSSNHGADLVADRGASRPAR
jgi:hypothetical protein